MQFQTIDLKLRMMGDMFVCNYVRLGTGVFKTMVMTNTHT